MERNSNYVLLLVIAILLAVILGLLICRPGQRTISKEGNRLWQKLGSRKFWVAVGGFIATMCTTWGVDEVTTGQLVGTCTAVGICIAYIGGESYADGNSPTNKSDILQKKEEEI